MCLISLNAQDPPEDGMPPPQDNYDPVYGNYPEMHGVMRGLIDINDDMQERGLYIPPDRDK